MNDEESKQKNSRRGMTTQKSLYASTVFFTGKKKERTRQAPLSLRFPFTRVTIAFFSSEKMTKEGMNDGSDGIHFFWVIQTRFSSRLILHNVSRYKGHPWFAVFFIEF